MKKKVKKNLTLGKSTIVNLEELNAAKGGTGETFLCVTVVGPFCQPTYADPNCTTICPHDTQTDC